LQELCIDTFVPNDCRLAGGSNAVETAGGASGQLEQLASTIFVTGSSHSGKTTHLKQVALITYMVHIDSFAPAESALVGKERQKILWAEVRKETRRWKSRWKSRDLFADAMCGQAVLDSLSSTDVGRLVPAVEEGDAGRVVSEWERRERREREEELRAEAAVLGAEGELDDGEGLPLFLPTSSSMESADEGVRDGSRFPLLFPL